MHSSGPQIGVSTREVERDSLVKTHNHNQVGFTLTEVLIVLATIGVAAAITFPAVHQYRENQRLRSQAAVLAARINAARSRSAGTNQLVRVSFAPSTMTPSDGFFTMYLDRNRNAQLDAGEVEAAAFTDGVMKNSVLGFELDGKLSFGRPTGATLDPLGGTLAIDGVSFTNDQITFSPDGTSAESGSIGIVDANGKGYAVTVSIGGATRVYYFDGTAWK